MYDNYLIYWQPLNVILSISKDNKKSTVSVLNYRTKQRRGYAMVYPAWSGAVTHLSCQEATRAYKLDYHGFCKSDTTNQDT